MERTKERKRGQEECYRSVIEGEEKKKRIYIGGRADLTTSAERAVEAPFYKVFLWWVGGG